MKIDLSLTFLIFTTIVYLIPLYFCIQNFKLTLIKFVLLLLTTGYVGSLSFILIHIEFLPREFNYILIFFRSNFTIILWLLVIYAINDSINIKKNTLLIIIILKELLQIILMIVNSDYIKYGAKLFLNWDNIFSIFLGVGNNYFFIILSFIELFKAYKNPRVKLEKIKFIKTLFLGILFLHGIFIFIIINTIIETDSTFVLRHINIGIFSLSLLIITFYILQVEKNFISEKKYANRLMNFEKLDSNLEKRLLDLIQIEKIFKNPELTPDEIAKNLSIDVFSLRHLINSKLGYKNFFEFIKEFRLNESIQILKTFKKGDIINFARIATESGFSNYSSFYRGFKQKYKLSPNEYFENQPQED